MNQCKHEAPERLFLATWSGKSTCRKCGAQLNVGSDADYLSGMAGAFAPIALNPYLSPRGSIWVFVALIFVCAASVLGVRLLFLSTRGWKRVDAVESAAISYRLAIFSLIALCGFLVFVSYSS